MRKGDFSLEILVDNEVLPEYEVPLSEKAKLTRSREKQTVTYVAVPYPSCHFCIRVGIHTTLGSLVYKGVQYVDGQNDDTYMELDPLNDDPYTHIYGFYNYDKTVFHKFKFDTNCWTDDEIFVSNLPTRCTKTPCAKKDLGVISVYIFTAERLAGKRLMSQCQNNQDVMPESPDNVDPFDVICLDEPQEEPMPNLRAIYNKPVAELHIRYQTKEWLQNKRFNLNESPDNLSVIVPNSALFEGRETDNEIVTSEQNEKVSDDYDTKEFLAEIDEEHLPSVVINDTYYDDVVIENIHNFGDEDETKVLKDDEEFESKGLKETDKVEIGNLNYEVVRENLNEYHILEKAIEKNLDREVESRILSEKILTEKNIINNVELVINERFNEKFQEVSINDKKEEKGTIINEDVGKGININNVNDGNDIEKEIINNQDEGGEGMMVIDQDKFVKEKFREFIDLTIESPKEVIEISDDNEDDVILVESLKSFLPTTVNKKKHRNKKIRYYSDSSIDWNNDDSSNYSDSSSEDEFVSLSKKRLRT